MIPFIAKQSTPSDLISKFKSIYARLLPLLKSEGKEASIKQIDSIFSRISSNNVTVLVCGEFKRGKSSLVNALIGEDLCPVDDCITTSSVSLIKYGATTKVTRHFLDSSNQTVTEIIDFDQIARFSKGSSANIDNTILLEIELPSEKLKSGLCVIDTPGIGGLDARHLSLTSFALTKADCILFVADAGEPISASELEFIKNKISPFGKNLKVVLNKIDTLSEEQIPVLLKDTQQKIAQVASFNNVEVIPTSIYQWQLYGVTEDEAYREASNMSGLEAGLADISKNFKESLYPLLKSRLIQASEDVKVSYQTKLQALSDPNPDLIARLQEQGKAIAQAKKDIEQPSSKFNRDLTAMMDKSQNEVMKKLSAETIILSSTKLEDLLCSDYVNSSSGAKHISEKLNESLLSLSSQLDTLIDQSFENITEKAQLSFSEDKPAYNSLLSSDIKLKEKTLSEKIFLGTRNGMAGMGVLSATSIVCGLIGASVLALPIAAIGGIGGICMSYKSIVSASRANNRAEIRQQIQPRLTIAINELRTYVQNRFKNFNNQLKEMLLERVAELEAEMMGIRIQLDECATDMQKIATHKSELQKKITFTETTSNQLEVLLKNPF